MALVYLVLAVVLAFIGVSFAETNTYDSELDLHGVAAIPVDKSTPPRYFSADAAGSGHRDCRFSSVTINSAYQWGRLAPLLAAWSRFTIRHKTQYWICHGTLLGWHWGKTVMDFDDDADVCMTKRHLRQLVDLNGTVFEGRFLLDINPSGVVWHPAQPINAIDAEFIDLQGGYKIDITAFGIRPEPRVEPGMIGACDGHTDKMRDILPVHKSTLDGLQILVPHNPAALLESEYGKRFNLSQYKDYTFDGYEWRSKSLPVRAERFKPEAFFTNNAPFWIPWESRARFAKSPNEQDANALNAEIESQLSSVDVDNTIAPAVKSIPASMHVVEFNIARGGHWKEACDKIRSGGVPDVVFINEADWGMSRSDNEHVARLMAFELGLNYAWGVEFLELSPGNKAETEKAKAASDCVQGRRGVGFTQKVDALGLHGNAILSKFPLTDVHVVRSPGIDRLYGTNSALTAGGYELRLGGRMVLYATIALENSSPVHLGCFHHQMMWDSRFAKEWAAVGKPTLDAVRGAVATVDPSGKDLFILGGDGWGTRWCDEIGIPNVHEYVSGDWICARGFKASQFLRTKSDGVSDHDMFSITLTSMIN
jgi:endonuclease/exonuclease/phosphatase family metal-dependent hydrolase